MSSFNQRCECICVRVSPERVRACVCVCVCDRWVEQQCSAGLLSRLSGSLRLLEIHRAAVVQDVGPASVCVKSRWRRMMEESDSLPCPAEDGLLSSWRWNRTARDQVQIKQKIRDLPGLLKHGLNLRKKSVSYPCMMKVVCFQHQYTTHIHHH